MALAPARRSSTASSPDVTPPTPTMAASGKATRQSYTARTATGWMGGPDSPPPPAPSRNERVSGSMAMPITVLISVRLSAPASRAAAAVLDVGATHVALHGHDRRRRVGQHGRRLGIVLDREAPDAGDNTGARPLEVGQLLGPPRLHARVLQA